MQDITYIGEQLWLGRLGHLLVILSFVAALFSLVSYLFSVQKKIEPQSKQWLQLGRWGYYTHSLSLLGLMSLVFYAMYHQMYEYSYVFDHVSPELPLKYILSAFWEGQEGSFMLWMAWHAVLGCILIKSSKELEPYILAVFALAEAILMSMILGIHIPWGDESIKIGSSPFTLLRQMNEAPIFLNAEYLSLIKGRGMNPLLQNYWMTIHPPTLFLGFASTLVPFAYAIAGLWKNEHKDWLRASLPWSLFSAGILGTGILMGSLWAYVALSFGGYWAWDPVENASLVPWITLVAGIHVHLVSRNTGYATKSVYFLYLLTFILILYSTFLTRSGVLGDTSAHAFTEMGLEWQLIILIGTFFLWGMGLWIARLSQIPSPEKEEEVTSREFWMYIGSLVLLFGATLIIASTSLPVYNKIMTWINPAWEGRVIQNVIEHYNKYQLWIAVFVSILSSVSIYMRYGAANWAMQRKKYFSRLSIHVIIAGIFTWLLSLWIDYVSWQFTFLSFAALFAITTSVSHLISTGIKKPALAWSSLAHLGFGMMVVGTIASGLNQKPISSNPFVFKGMFTDEDLKKYVQLIKGKPLLSQGYLITYQSDTLQGRERKYSILFQKLNDSLQVTEEMRLHPTAMYSNDFSKIAAFNPDTRHFIDKDIFSCVVGLPPAIESMENAKKIEDTLSFKPYLLAQNDSLIIGDYTIKSGAVSYLPGNVEYLREKHDAGISLPLIIHDNTSDTSYQIEPALGIEGSLMYNYPAGIEEAGLRIKLAEENLDQFFTPEDKLKYSEFTIKSGGTIEVGGTLLQLTGFDRNPEHPAYSTKEGDIAVGARLTILDNSIKEEVNPVYVIRDNQPMSIKQYNSRTGIHVRFTNIDPETETFTFRIAKDEKNEGSVRLAIATGVPRSDYLILQATIFPGINLFWVGSILMMVSLCLAGVYRLSQKYA